MNLCEVRMVFSGYVLREDVRSLLEGAADKMHGVYAVAREGAEVEGF